MGRTIIDETKKVGTSCEQKLNKKEIKQHLKMLKKIFNYRQTVYFPLKELDVEKDALFLSEGIAFRNEKKITDYLLKNFKTIYKTGEKFFGNWGEIVDKSNFWLNYGGIETVYFDDDYSWMIYVSHEETVSFIGDIVLNIKELLNSEKAFFNTW